MLNLDYFGFILFGNAFHRRIESRFVLVTVSWWYEPYHFTTSWSRRNVSRHLLILITLIRICGKRSTYFNTNIFNFFLLLSWHWSYIITVWTTLENTSNDTTMHYSLESIIGYSFINLNPQTEEKSSLMKPYCSLTFGIQYVYVWQKSVCWKFRDSKFNTAKFLYRQTSNRLPLRYIHRCLQTRLSALSNEASVKMTIIQKKTLRRWPLNWLPALQIQY